MSGYNLSPSDDQRISFVPAGPLAESMSKYKGIDVELYQDADDEKEESLNLRRKSRTSIQRHIPVQNRKDRSDSHSLKSMICHQIHHCYIKMALELSKMIIAI